MILTRARVRPATTDDAAIVSEILSQGFADDPVFAWVLDDPSTRAHYIRAFFDVFAPFNLEHGTVDMTADGTGVGLWFEVEPSEPSDEGEIGEQIAEACGPHLERFGILDELMTAAHPMEKPHGYLHFLSTIPAFQGSGIGNAILNENIRRLDLAGKPAYLEATTTRSAALYARHGFKHLPKTIDLPGGPSMYPMWREPFGG